MYAYHKRRTYGHFLAVFDLSQAELNNRMIIL